MFRSALCAAAMMLVLPVSAGETPQGATGPKKTRKKAVPSKPKGPVMITTESGLKYIDTKPGTGATPQKGQSCAVHYTGWLSDKGKKGEKFDSSVDRGEPLTIPIGIGRVIKGWDEGLLTMKVGGERTLYIPASLGYGARGAGGVIPPNADLIFDVVLVAIK